MTLTPAVLKSEVPASSLESLKEALCRVTEPLSLPDNVFVPACRLENLGDPSFLSTHGVKYAYVTGAMANGIASIEIVEAMSRAGVLGFFWSGRPIFIRHRERY